MDKEQEQLQFLGFIGIFKESLKIILSSPKIFTKISLAFILPLSFIALLNVELSKLLNNSITSNPQQLPPISSKLILFWVFEIVVGLLFSLLSISAVIYTVACIYTGKEVTFKKIMSVIPKVWKRLMITLVSNFCILLAYIFIVALVLIICVIIISLNVSKRSDLQVWITIVTIVMAILLSVGLIYTAIFWQLSNVISVMEEYCGFKAMKKSRQLIKGKLGTAIAIFVVLSICYVPIEILHRQIGQRDRNVGIGPNIILYGILSILLNPLILLYNLVVHTVFYFVCKSYHHENINKSALADHLESFHGGYVPLIKGNVEFERLNNV